MSKDFPVDEQSIQKNLDRKTQIRNDKANFLVKDKDQV